MSNYIVTAGQVDLDISNPRPGHITAFAIAWSLSQLNRFTGHALRPYSVAEHSLLVCDIAERVLGLDVHGQFAALMHDAHEFITGDLHTPGKHMVGHGWRRWEDSMQHAVLSAFSLVGTHQMHAASIKRADLIALATERRDLLPTTPGIWPVLTNIEPLATVDLYSPERIDANWETWRDCWLDRYHELEAQRNRLIFGYSRHTPATPNRLGHEWDEDACCIHCGQDGAEVAHLAKTAAYERTDSDRWCEARERTQRSNTAIAHP